MRQATRSNNIGLNCFYRHVEEHIAELQRRSTTDKEDLQVLSEQLAVTEALVNQKENELSQCKACLCTKLSRSNCDFCTIVNCGHDVAIFTGIDADHNIPASILQASLSSIMNDVEAQKQDAYLISEKTVWESMLKKVTLQRDFAQKTVTVY